MQIRIIDKPSFLFQLPFAGISDSVIVPAQDRLPSLDDHVLLATVSFNAVLLVLVDTKISHI